MSIMATSGFAFSREAPGTNLHTQNSDTIITVSGEDHVEERLFAEDNNELIDTTNPPYDPSSNPPSTLSDYNTTTITNHIVSTSRPPSLRSGPNRRSSWMSLASDRVRYASSIFTITSNKAVMRLPGFASQSSLPFWRSSKLTFKSDVLLESTGWRDSIAEARPDQADFSGQSSTCREDLAIARPELADVLEQPAPASLSKRSRLFGLMKYDWAQDEVVVNAGTRIEILARYGNDRVLARFAGRGQQNPYIVDIIDIQVLDADGVRILPYPYEALDKAALPTSLG